MNKSIFLSISLIIFLAFIVFQVNNSLLGGYLASKDLAARELKSSPEALFDWKLSEEAPFKYRILFKYLVESTYNITHEKDPDAFFIWLKYFNMLFLICSAISLFYLLFFLFKNVNYALSGVIIYLSSPAIMMAFSLPVHTREDHLGFTILNIGLLSLLKRKWRLFMILCIIGVMTRETLMLLPFVFLFFIKYSNFSTRLMVCALPLITLIILHLTLGYEPYDHWVGLRWNLNNLDQVFGFAFITFSWMWIAFLYNFKHAFGDINKDMISEEINILIKSAPFALILVALTTFFGGIFNEIRLIYIIYPWVITSTLWSIKNLGMWKTFSQMIKSKHFIIFLAAISAILISLLFNILDNYSIFPPFKFDIPIKSWVIVSILQIFLFCTFLYIFIYRIKEINNDVTQGPPS